jgi:hypothetical protein
MTQPAVMRTVEYLYGIDIVDGNDAWAMFCASVAGISRLLEKDSRLGNSQTRQSEIAVRVNCLAETNSEPLPQESWNNDGRDVVERSMSFRRTLLQSKPAEH